jgi:hypothetical protein
MLHSYKDHGQFRNFTVNQSLQFSASHARHTDVTNQTVKVRKAVTFEKFRWRMETDKQHSRKIQAALLEPRGSGGHH